MCITDVILSKVQKVELGGAVSAEWMLCNVMNKNVFQIEYVLLMLYDKTYFINDKTCHVM